MQVTIKRTGGYAGLDQTLVSKDLDTLTANKRSGVVRRLRNLQKAVEEAGPHIGADLMTYEVEVEQVPDVPERLVVVDTGEPGTSPMKQVNGLIAALS